MRETAIVSLVSLGLCEHCNTLLSMQNMPTGSMDAVWKCSNCSGVLTGQSFGYEGSKKARWVGPYGTWTTERPEVSFQLGDWHVTCAAVASAN